MCEITVGDPLLRPAKEVWRELRVRPDFLKALDPHGQSKWWSFYRGVIPESGSGFNSAAATGTST